MFQPVGLSGGTSALQLAADALVRADFSRHRTCVGRNDGLDETTVYKFRHLSERNNLGDAMLETVNLHFESRGIKINTVTIIDATIIHSAVATPTSIADSAVLRILFHGNETKAWGD